jgi:porin
MLSASHVSSRHRRLTLKLTAVLLAGTACCGFWTSPAAAQTPGSLADRPADTRVDIGQFGTAPPPTTGPDADGPGFFTGILKRDKLLGDMGGLRTLLGRYGVTLTLTDQSDVLGNVSGGIDKGATYSAVTTLTLQMDTQKAFGWDGGTINVSGLQIRGRSLSQFYLANLQTASGITAEPTTRLMEVWFQQAFAGGRYDIRLGQQAIDQEFILSKESALFLNTAMGWPALPSADLFAGGPAFPLSSLGVRFRAQPTGAVTVLAGVFQDNPPGGPFNDDSQLRGSTRWGGNFNLRTGALFIAEVQYVLNQPADGDMDHGGGSEGLPGTYKLGAWFDTAAFPNQRYDTMGVPLASPASNGIPRMNLRNASIYGLFDQMVWRPDPDSSRAVSVFARAMGGPDDRNLISFSANAGVTLKAPLPRRDDDTFGVGFGVANISSSASGFDRDTNFYGTAPFPVPVRSVETFLEVTYQIQVTPWLQIQPDFQYIFNPGGGIANPNNPALRVKNEAVFGVRTGVTF